MIEILKQGDSLEKMKKIQKNLTDKLKTKGINAKKYCGTIKLKEAPLAIQKRMRNEWK